MVYGAPISAWPLHWLGTACLVAMPSPQLSCCPSATERFDRLHHAAQFGEALEAADKRIAGIDPLLPIIAEQVSVGGAHRDFRVRALLGAAAVLFRHQRRNQANHVGFAGQVVGFEERAVRLSLVVAQMG